VKDTSKRRHAVEDITCPPHQNDRTGDLATRRKFLVKKKRRNARQSADVRAMAENPAVMTSIGQSGRRPVFRRPKKKRAFGSGTESPFDPPQSTWI